MKKESEVKESCHNLTPIVQTIVGWERAWALYEIHEQSPNSRGFHRYQIIQVKRDGIMHEWRKDMGLASKWKGCKQLRIPSFWEHTVDELIDLAQELRHEQKIDVKELLELDSYKPA